MMICVTNSRVSAINKINSVRVFLILCLLLLSGCGGSGSSSSSLSSIPPLTTGSTTALLPRPGTPSFTGTESDYSRLQAVAGQSGLVSIRAPKAYANLYQYSGANAAIRPGNNVVIGFIDTGLDQEHPSFSGKRVAVEYFGGASKLGEYKDGSRFSHGTAVASIATGVPVGAQNSNGRVVASFQGVSPGADVRMFAIPLGSAPPDNIVSAPTEEDLMRARLGGGLAEVYRNALDPDRKVDVLNLSFGFDSNIADYLESTLRATAGEVIRILEQRDRSDKAILVWAAGNNNGDRCETGTPSCLPNRPEGFFNASSPSIFSGLHARIEELQDHSVAVVAVRPNGEIAEFSNRCGIAAKWCIAAPGVGILLAYSRLEEDGETVRQSLNRASGTSFSAPIVSGGLALMKQRFRGQMRNTELLARLLATADKTGIYADEAIYGQGLMDLGAATEPVGMVAVVTGDSVKEHGVGLSDTRLLLGHAFGDGVARSFAGREIAAFDSLGAPFWFPLDGIAKSSETSPLQSQLQSFMDFPVAKTAIHSGGGAGRTSNKDRRLQGGAESPSVYASTKIRPQSGGGKGNIPSLSGFSSRGDGGGLGTNRFSIRAATGGIATRQTLGLLRKSGHLSFIYDPVSVGVGGANGFAVSAFTSGERELKPVSGAVISYRPHGLPFGFRSGWISESKTLLGSSSGGAFGDLSATTVFAGIGWDYGFGKWLIAADAEIGSALPENDAGLISDFSRMTTSAFALGLTRNLPGGSLIRLSLSSPLRVESGRMNLNVPVGRTKNGEVLRSSVKAGLSPSGRQIDIGAQWIAPVAAGNLSVGAVASRHPGHNESIEPSLSLLAGYSVRF